MSIHKRHKLLTLTEATHDPDFEGQLPDPRTTVLCVETEPPITYTIELVCVEDRDAYGSKYIITGETQHREAYTTSAAWNGNNVQRGKAVVARMLMTPDGL